MDNTTYRKDRGSDRTNPNTTGNGNRTSGRSYDSQRNGSAYVRPESGSYSGTERGATSRSRAYYGEDEYGYSRTSSGNRSSSGTTRNAASSGRSYPGGASSGTSRSASGASRGYGSSSGGSYGGSSGNRKKKRRKKKKYRLRIQPRFFFLLAIFLVVVAIIIVALKAFGGTTEQPQTLEETKKPGILAEIFKTPTPSPTPSPSPTPTPTPPPPYEIPHAVDSTQPSVFGMSSAVEVNGTRVDSYQRDEKLEFLPDEPYTNATGVITFRGNNFRSEPAFGTASITSRKLTPVWSVTTGEMHRGMGYADDRMWTGSGWVGQPLIVQWPDNIKQLMNMYDWAKQKAGLVEVILATMDGNVYFIDLETGEPTRDKLFIGMPFKGAGSLDPRGYPILYLGSGDMYADDSQKSRAMVYSLIDFTRLYEFGKQNDEFSLRDWHAYDSAPLVDAETDTLIYPGENGILYTIKLNTQFDETTGALSVNPSEVVKMRYVAERSTYPESSSNKFWLGYETSIATLGEYGYLGTNDGFLQCINLNTMSLVWAQDTGDDTNGSPVLETDFDNRAAYLYIGPSLHFTADGDSKGSVSLYKVNAITGEIVWKHTENVNTKSGVSGGIQATAILGKNNISDLVIIPFARTPNENDGVLLALDKATGAVRWTFVMEKYTWSSPVAVYDASGNGYIVVCEGYDTGSKVFLLDGQTGTLLSTADVEKSMEASPAVYGNMIVIGTRGMKIWGIKIS